jgi:DNA gyrase/topoisomerase IV subunit A
MGSVGIAVGMATNIPPHNLREVVQALQFVLGHKERETITVEDLMEFIKGPDFPTGGVVYNRADILSAYATGRGSIILRGKAVIEETAAGRPVIIINELPYQTTPSSIVEQVAHLITEKIVNGIAEVRDESNKDGIRVVIELKRDSFPREVLNQLFKLTGLQSSFAYNMIALTDRGLQPKLFNLKEILEEFLVHRQEVIKRRTAYELRIAEERAHILEGLKIALDHIDEVIETIKKSKDRQDASDKLQTKFKLSEKQAVAILEMQLQRLSGLERKKIEDELAEKLLLIADLKDILAKPARVDAIVSDELTEINDKYGDDRRTEVHSAPLGQFSAKDTIPNEEVIITLSKQGYVKRLKAGTYRTQNVVVWVSQLQQKKKMRSRSSSQATITMICGFSHHLVVYSSSLPTKSPNFLGQQKDHQSWISSHSNQLNLSPRFSMPTKQRSLSSSSQRRMVRSNDSRELKSPTSAHQVSSSSRSKTEIVSDGYSLPVDQTWCSSSQMKVRLSNSQKQMFVPWDDQQWVSVVSVSKEKTHSSLRLSSQKAWSMSSQRRVVVSGNSPISRIIAHRVEEEVGSRSVLSQRKLVKSSPQPCSQKKIENQLTSSSWQNQDRR